MIRHNRKKVRMGLSLKCHLENGTVKLYQRRSLKAFFNVCRSCTGRRFDVIVTYHPGIFNSGKYFTRKDLLFALRCFTNSLELDFVEKYWKK